MDFKELLAKGNSKEEIMAKCPQEKYESLEHLDDDFFNKNFLGFAYIVPSTTTEEEQQKFSPPCSETSTYAESHFTYWKAELPSTS